MIICSFEELSKKEVISCLDCSRLGYIVDLNIQLENAQIISIKVEPPCNFFNFHKKNIITIPWECIKKIGDDLIICDFIRPIEPPNKEAKGGFFKFLFKN